MPLNELWPKPVERACWNASSRLGPVTPVVPARLRVWQEPHLATKSCLPATTLSPLSFSWQPEMPTSSAAAATAASPLPLGMRRDRTGSGGGQAFEAALRRGQHGPRHAVPRVALARDHLHRIAGGGPERLGRLEPAGHGARQLRDGVRAALEAEQWPRGLRNDLGERGRDLP